MSFSSFVHDPIRSFNFDTYIWHLIALELISGIITGVVIPVILGIALTKSDCVACRNCDSNQGFYWDAKDQNCLKKVCTCPNGFPVDYLDCVVPGEVICASCKTGFSVYESPTSLRVRCLSDVSGRIHFRTGHRHVEFRNKTANGIFFRIWVPYAYFSLELRFS